MQINVVLPMAGQGSRFANVGYKKPKPFVDVLGLPMIERVLQNLMIPDARYILISRKEHLDQEKELVLMLKQKYNVEFVVIDQLTEGAAMTVLHTHRLINSEVPLLIANSDQIVDMNVNRFIEDMLARKLDGSILTFNDSDPKWSYAKINQEGHVDLVREKEVISDHATVGIYLFRHGRDFVEAAIDMIVRNDRVKNEFYVCPVYNYAIKRNAKVGIFDIKKENMHGTGTPEDLELYLQILKGKQ